MDRYELEAAGLQWIVNRLYSWGLCDCDDEQCLESWDRAVDHVMFEFAP
jgi:hypothetical protein